MDVNRFFNYGGDYVKNPNYKKGNGQPKYITSVDANPKVVSGVLTNTADLPTVFNPDKTSDRLARGMLEHNLPLRREDYINNNFNNILAESQSGIEQAKNSLIQMASEVTLGTVKGFADLFDMLIYNNLRDNIDYQNPVSSLLEDWQEAIREDIAPVYADQSKNVFNGGLLDSGFIFQGLPSIMSSLTLMIPSRALTLGGAKYIRFLGNKGVSWLRKAEQANRAIVDGEKLSKAAKLDMFLNDANAFRRTKEFTEFGVSGFASRLLENYQEARQTYRDSKDIYRELWNKMDTAQREAAIERLKNENGTDAVNWENEDEVIDLVSRNAADKTFVDDLWNTGFDIYQMYALAKPLRAINGPSRAALRRFQRTQLQNLGKSEKEINQIIANRTRWQKTKDAVSDFAFGAKHTMLSELSEGVEEAVNYIAQEEGMTYGKILLGTYEGGDLGQRLKQYAVNPKLWDSAFWGFIGGITFAAGGAQINRLTDARRIQQKAEEVNKVHPEFNVKIPTFWEAYRQTENDNRLRNLKSRADMYKKAIGDLIKIKNGEDINGITQNGKLESEGEIEAARNYRFLSFVDDVLLDAMDSGNYDMAREFLESDELANAFIESGYMSKKDMDNLRTNVRTRGEELIKKYNKHLRIARNATESFGRQNDADLWKTPAEFFNLVARQNIKHELTAEYFQSQIDAINASDLVLEDDVKEKLNEAGVDFKGMIDTIMTAHQIGMINAQIADIENSSRKSTLTGQNDLRLLKLQKKVLEEGLSNQRLINKKPESDVNRLSRILLGLQNAASVEVVPGSGTSEGNPIAYQANTANDNYITFKNTVESKDKELIKKLHPAIEEILDNTSEEEQDNLISRALRQSNVANQQLETIYRDINTGELTGEAKLLKNISEQLATNYANLSTYQHLKNFERAQIATTKDEVLQQVHMISNFFNEDRQVVIEQGNALLHHLAKKYGKDNILAELTQYLEEGIHSDYFDAFEKEERDAFDYYVKLMNLMQPQNDLLLGDVRRSLNANEIHDFTIDKPVVDRILDERRRAAEKSSTSEKPVTGASTLGSTISSADTEETAEETKSGEIEEIEDGEEKEESEFEDTEGEVIIGDTRSDTDNTTTNTGLDISKSTNYLYRHSAHLSAVKNIITTANNDVNAVHQIVEKTKQEIDKVKQDLEEVKRQYAGRNDISDVTRGPLAQLGILGQRLAEAEAAEFILNSDEGAIETAFDETSVSDKTKLEQIKQKVLKLKQEISSTGEEEQPFDEDMAMIEIADAIKSLATSENKSLNDESVIARIKQVFKEDNTDLTDEVVDVLFSRAKTLNAAESGEEYRALESEIADGVIRLSAINTSDPTSLAAKRAKQILNSSFEELLKTYNTYLGRGTVNGKQVIYLESLLRYAKAITNNKYSAEQVFAAINKIIVDNPNKYVVVSENQDTQHIIQEVAKPITVRRANLDDRIGGKNFDFAAVINKVDKDTRKKILDALEKCKVGDKIICRLNNNRTTKKKFDGTKFENGISFFLQTEEGELLVAVAPTPASLDGTKATGTGHWYEQENGWFHEFDYDTNNAREYELEKFFKDLLTSDDTDAVEFRRLLHEYESLRFDEYQALEPKYIAQAYPHLEAFARNKGYNIDKPSKTAKPRYLYAIGETSFEDQRRRFRHISALDVFVLDEQALVLESLGFVKRTAQEEADSKRDSIHQWFLKMIESSNARQQIKDDIKASDDDSTIVTIATKNEPTLIITDEAHAAPVSVAIADKHKDSIKIATGTIGDTSTVTASGQAEPFSIVGQNTKSRTVVLIDKPQGGQTYINAYPINMKAPVISTNNKMKAFKLALETRLKELLDEWKDTKDSTALQAFIYELVGVDSKASSLFRGFRPQAIPNTPNGFRIPFRVKNGEIVPITDTEGTVHYLNFFDSVPSAGGRIARAAVQEFDTTPGVNNEKATIWNRTPKDTSNLTAQTRLEKRIIDVVINSLIFKIDPLYILADNSPSVTHTGIASRDADGNFILKVSGIKNVPKALEDYKDKDGNIVIDDFGSFGDFILKNDLVNLSTTHYGNTNFEFRDNNKGQLGITYTLDNNPVSSPVEGIDTTPPAKPASVEETLRAKVESIFDKASKSKRKQNISKQLLTTIVEKLGETSSLYKIIYPTERSKTPRIPTILNSLLHSNVKEIKDFNGASITYKDSSITIVPDNASAMYVPEDCVITTANGTIQLHKGDIVVGDIFMNWLDGNNTELYDAIRSLIHENLHASMDEKKVDSPYNNEYLISGLEEIYNELKAAKPDSKFVTKDLSKLSKSKKQYELEEFLVESLTNFELIKELNEVSAENVILPTKKKSLLAKLLDRILNWLKDFLGKDFNVNKDSLLAKEFEIFESVINETPADTTNREEPTDSSTGDVTEPIEPDTIVPDNNAINNADIDSIDLSGMFSTVAVSNQDNISSEMQAIKERAIADGTFMKAPNGNPTNLTERQWLQVRTKAFKDWFGDWEKAFIIPMSFMPKKGWVVGKIIDNPIDAANICDNTQIKVLNSIIKQFGKPNNKGKFYAKPVTIWAKSPINNKQIHHSTVAVRINGKIYLYDMPQSEYIKYNSENNGTVIKEYSPRLIEYTEENLKTLYGTADENIHLNDESILDNDIIELPLTNASKVVDENGEPLVVYHGSRYQFNIIDFNKSEDKTSFFATDNKDTSSTYGLGQGYALFFNLKNPYILDGLGQPWNKLKLNEEDYTDKTEIWKMPFMTTKEIVSWAKEKGYDGVIFNDIIDNGKYTGIVYENESLVLQELEYKGFPNTYIKERRDRILDMMRADVFAAFDTPNQIKSATDNIGAFSSTNNDIRFSSLSVSNSTPSATAPSIRSFMANLDSSTYDDIQEKLNNGVMSITCK